MGRDGAPSVVIMTLAWLEKNTHRDRGGYGTALIRMSDFNTIPVIRWQLRAPRREVLGGFISLGET